MICEDKSIETASLALSPRAPRSTRRRLASRCPECTWNSLEGKRAIRGEGLRATGREVHVSEA